MKMMSLVRTICLMPMFLIYVAWMLCRLMLKAIFLFLAAWLIHTLFGKIGNFLLALPIIYLFSFLLPNPKIKDIGKVLIFKTKGQKNDPHAIKAEVVDFKSFQRGAKP